MSLGARTTGLWKCACGTLTQPLARQTRLFATSTPLPPAFDHTTPEASTSTARLSGTADAGDVEGTLPPNLTFLDAEVDGSDEVMQMLERDNAFASSVPTSGPSSLAFLPLSSLASSNPTLASQEGLAIPLPPTVFQQPLRRDILHRCVVYYLSLLRQGTGSTKTRADVNYSGKKLIRQKGSGRARVGDAGSGIRRGGGTIHGPHPRNFAQALPRKVQHLGLHVALSQKLREGLVRVVQDVGEAGWSKTGKAVEALSDKTEARLRYEAEEDALLREEERTEKELEAVKAIEAEGAQVLEGEKVVEAAEPVVEAAVEVEEPVVEEAQADEVTTISTSVVPHPRFGPSKNLSILFVHAPLYTFSPLQSASLKLVNQVIRNIPGIDVLGVEELQAYEVLRRKWCVMDVGSVEWLAERAGEDELLDMAEELAIEADAEATGETDALEAGVMEAKVEGDELRV